MSDKIEHVEEEKSVAVSNEQFSTKLYNVLKEEEGNLIMSPFSVSAVMAMVSTGAGGKTLQEIKLGLSFPSSSTLMCGYQDTIPALRSTDNFTMEVVNSVFAMKDFSVLPEFQDMLNRSFQLLRQVQALLNDWLNCIAIINNLDSHNIPKLLLYWDFGMSWSKTRQIILRCAKADFDLTSGSTEISN